MHCSILFVQMPAMPHCHIMQPPYHFSTIAICLYTMLLSSCGSDRSGSLPADVLVRVGDAELTISELHSAMPFGLSPSDSTACCKSYINNWIKRKAVGLVAARNIADTRRIDHMAEEYRNNLLIWEYRNQMAAQQKPTAYSDDTLRAEYDRNPSLYRCTQPMLKGIFLSVDKKNPHLANMRRWSRSTTEADLERLEKESLDPDVDYLYFLDRWISWADIASRVPGGVDIDPEKHFTLHPGFETTVGDRIYMLSVDKYLAPGAQMPFDMARESVIGTLNAVGAAAYDRKLRDDLVTRAYQLGVVTLSPLITDPVATDTGK